MLPLCCMVNYMSACDVCGGQDGYAGQGLLALVQGHFLSVQHQYTRYGNTYIPLSEYKPVTYGITETHSVQAGGRYYFSTRWQISAYMPFKISTLHTDTGITTISGAGDLTAIASYTVLRTAEGTKARHLLMTGAGIIVPTGKTGNGRLNENSAIVQPGTGAYSIPLNANYALMLNKTGISIDASWLITFANRQDYKFGNKLNTNAMAYRMIATGRVSIIPQAGMRYEYALHDYDNFSKKWLNGQSGGYVLSARAGGQVRIGNISIQAFAGLPVAQYLNKGSITLRLKTEAGIILLL